ncbi:MAG: cell division FtsZ family protein [Verrucomicrobia bacterium]|nr:cell division FtsZ family protein [Verrucomicrobiota bacterium]
MRVQSPDTDSREFDLSEQDFRKPRVLVVGVGGGGANMVSNLADAIDQFAEIAVVDSDSQVLERTRVPRCVQIGHGSSAGLGAGGDPSQGREAADSSEIKLRELVSGHQLVFIITTLGGGIGTGAAPVVAGIAREEDALVLAFASLPFSFEGEEKARIARLGVKELSEFCQSVVVLPNDRLLDQVSPGEALTESLRRADEFMGECTSAVCELLLQGSLINLDFGDLMSVASHSGGTCCFGFGRGSGQHRIDRALTSLMKSPYFGEGAALNKAKGLLIAVRGGEDLSLQELQTVVSTITEQATPEAHVYLAAGSFAGMKGRLSVTVLASEQWVEEASSREDIIAAEDAATPSPAAAAGRARTSSRKRKVKQTQLTLEPQGKGRFKDVEPTFYEGEDLDIPTFIRHDLKLLG